MKHQSETKRFFLRPFRMSDLDDFFEMESDPEVHEFLGKTPVQSKEDLEKIIGGVFHQYERNGIGRWAIEAKNTGEVVGWSGLKLEDKARDFEFYDVGYRIKRKHWGKGIASEVGLESVRYGFVDMRLDKICGGAEVEHGASNHLLQKIGLKPAGTFEIFGKDHHWFEAERKTWLTEMNFE